MSSPVQVEKKVPWNTMSIMLALLIQSGGLIWWAADINARLIISERLQDQHVSSDAHGTAGNQLAALEARQQIIMGRQNQILNSLNDIHQDLSKIE